MGTGSSSASILPRERLLATLRGLGDYRIVYIQAPGGYGKTVTANLWIGDRDCPRAVVTFNELDDNRSVICRKLCYGLMSLEPDNPVLREYAMHPAFETAPDEFAIRCYSSITPDAEGRLVLDDIQFLEQTQSVAFLCALLKRLPPGIRVLVASRREPAPCFSELRLKHQLTVLDSDDMRFSREEILDLYRRRGHMISWEEAGQVLEFTEGWPIGISALFLSGNAIPSRKILPEELEDYIGAQVWAYWDERTRSFALKTALEDELDAPLCQALTGEADSAGFLDRFERGNMFLWKGAEGRYRFHSLFRAFLLHRLDREEEAFRMELLKRAGDYYFGREDYYRAVDRYIKCRDEENIYRSIVRLVDTTPGDRLLIENFLAISRIPLIAALVDKLPDLLWLRAWTSYLDGDAPQMEESLDRFYQYINSLTEAAPGEWAKLMYICCTDYRTELTDWSRRLRLVDLKLAEGFSAGAISQNMPLFHRSFRDFSELAKGPIKRKIYSLKQELGYLLGPEVDMFEACVFAGLHYERSELTEAHRYALSALSLLKPEFAPESKFCAMMLLAHVLHALHQDDRATLMVDNILEMVEEARAYYLSFNMDAYRYRVRMENGEQEAAREWLELHGTDPLGPVSFYRICGFYTTSRAHIVLGNYDKSIVILKKVLELAKAYRRPLDIMESQILLAIAFWRKRLAYQKEAMACLEEAVVLAQEYGYTQLFAAEGAALTTMLYRLQSHAVRKNYDGPVAGRFAKQLYLLCMAEAKYTRGLTGGWDEEAVKFTVQQKRVMALLCEGCSYRQIAERLGIKFTTVRSHIELIYRKLDVPNETEAVLKIRELGILEEETV